VPPATTPDGTHFDQLTQDAQFLILATPPTREPDTLSSSHSSWHRWLRFHTQYNPEAFPPTLVNTHVFIAILHRQGLKASSISQYCGYIHRVYQSLSHTSFTTIRQHPQMKLAQTGVHKFQDSLQHSHQPPHTPPPQPPTYISISTLPNLLLPAVSFDNLLFNAIISCDFFGLRRLAELTDGNPPATVGPKTTSGSGWPHSSFTTPT
jgi:hypothetical protein